MWRAKMAPFTEEKRTLQLCDLTGSGGESDREVRDFVDSYRLEQVLTCLSVFLALFLVFFCFLFRRFFLQFFH